MLAFQVDDTCHYPLHSILSDVIDKYTNSSTDCFKILNKIGVCISKDTHLRHQNVVIEKSLEVGPPIDPRSFTIGSADNINKRSSYATVKASDSHRRFDGTSVQLVQPNPCHLEIEQHNTDIFPNEKLFSFNKKVFSSVCCNGTPMETFFRAILITIFWHFQSSNRNDKGEIIEPSLNLQENSQVNSLKDMFHDFIIKNCDLLQSFYSEDNFTSPDEYLNFRHYLISDLRVPNEIDFKVLAFLTGGKVSIYNIDTANQLQCIASYEQPEVKSNYHFHLLQHLEYEEKFEALFNVNVHSEHANITFDASENLQDIFRNLQSLNNVVGSRLSFDENYLSKSSYEKCDTKSRRRTVDISLIDKKFNPISFPTNNACKISDA